MNAPFRAAAPQETAFVPARFSDDEFEDLIPVLSPIGRFELRNYELYRVNTRLDPDALSDPVFTPAEFTDDEFEDLIGTLGRIGRFELRNWKIYRTNAQYAPHARVKTRLLMSLDRMIETVGLPLEALSQASVRFGGGFAPNPDIVVWRVDDTRKAVPGALVRLIVEVSDSTLADDLGSKRGSYAEAGLPEYWVADVNAHVIHLFAHPEGDAFTRAGQVKFGDKVESLTVPGVIVDTVELLRL